MELTATHKIKRQILLAAARDGFALGVTDTAEQIDAAYEQLENDDRYYASDYESEIRGGQFETGLDCPSSRHYESKSVAMRCCDGSWVGWTYFFGGGKHGEPSAIPWMENAYDVQAREVVKVVYEFSRLDANENVGDAR